MRNLFSKVPFNIRFSDRALKLKFIFIKKLLVLTSYEVIEVSSRIGCLNFLQTVFWLKSSFHWSHLRKPCTFVLILLSLSQKKYFLPTQYPEVPNKRACSLRFLRLFSTILANLYPAHLSNSIKKFGLPAHFFHN